MTLDTIADIKSQAEIFEYVKDNARAWQLLRALDKEEVHALDFETTELSPMEGVVRLTSICGHGKQFILDHFYCGAFAEFAPFMAMLEWAVFQAPFEGRWFDHNAEGEWVNLLDVQNMRKAKLGGAPLSLKIMCKRDLKFDMDKTEQMSDWTKPELTQSQLAYAMLDAVATWQLWEHWLNELTAEQYGGFLVINDAWRGTAEMEDTGLVLDVEYHTKLLKWWTLKRDTAQRYLRRWAPPTILANLNSKQQLSAFIRDHMIDEKSYALWPKTEGPKQVEGKKQRVLKEQLNLERETLVQAAHRMPYPQNRWIAALIIYNKMQKYIGTYGQKMIDAQINFGKVQSRFNIAQAVTGRYSSSSFNLQNIPSNKVVRRSFTSRDPSKGETKMLIADYSSIEVRVLAELSGDERLLYDAIYGDVHSRSAAQIFNIPFDYFLEVINSDPDDQRYSNVRPAFKDMRRRAKAFTFQLLYGAGAAALAVVLRCTDEEAYRAIEAWATIYPKAYHYRQLMFEQMMHTGFLPVIDGRTIFVFKADRTMPVAANYPVQGAAASLMYRAVYHVHKMLYDSMIRARLAASVHDELLIYSNVKCAEQAAKILVDGMVQAWLDIFPNTDTGNLVGKNNKAVIGWHWGMKE